MASVQIRKVEYDLSASNFDCGNAGINQQVRNSYYPTLLQHMYAFEILVEKTVVGFYMVRFRRIQLQDCPDNISDYQSTLTDLCYSVHLQYIAIDSQYQHNGIGTEALRLLLIYVRALCVQWPIRLVTLDAVKDKVEWYKKIGFVPFSSQGKGSAKPEVEMYMDFLSDLSKVKEYCERHNVE